MMATKIFIHQKIKLYSNQLNFEDHFNNGEQIKKGLIP
jgi:hypothetical protein